MRKYVIGAIAGAALMFGLQAGAASLIGSKVAGTRDVTLNGKIVGQAAIINDLSYLPIRSLSNALDLGIDLSGGKINLSETEQSSAASTPAPVATPTPSPSSAQSSVLDEKIADREKLKYELMDVMLKKAKTPDDAELIRRYDELYKQVEGLDAEIKELEGNPNRNAKVDPIYFTTP